MAGSSARSLRSLLFICIVILICGALGAVFGPADIIIAVAGTPPDNINTSAVAELLKGQRATSVKTTILPKKSDKPMDFNIIRDEIPRASVDLHFMIRPGIGYMHVAGFQ